MVHSWYSNPILSYEESEMDRRDILKFSSRGNWKLILGSEIFAPLGLQHSTSGSWQQQVQLRKPKTSPYSSFFSVISSAAARKLLYSDDFDPKRVDLICGLDFKIVLDNDMMALRNLICAVLSLRDRRTWSSNGARTSVHERKTYLGKSFHTININL